MWMSEITRERTYPAPIERVWPLVSTAEGLASWLMPNDLQPVVGHRFSFTTRPAPGFDGVVLAEVVDVDPPRRISFTWVGGPLDTVVTFTLTPLQNGGTRLRMTHTGFAGLRATLVRRLLDQGWRRLLRRDLARAVADSAADGAPQGGR